MESPNVLVSDFEVNKEEKSYTIDTLEYLQKLYPQYDLIVVVGMDIVKDFTRWKEYQRILQIYKVLVFPRLDTETVPLLPGMTLMKDFPPTDESSSEVRRLLETGKDVRHLVPPPVFEYIQQHRTELYTTHHAK